MAEEAHGPTFEQECFGSTVPPGLVSALQENDFFYGVGHSLIDNSVKSFRVAHLPSATTLYTRRSVATRVFLILEGAVQILHPNVEIERPGEILYDGRFTGEVSLMPDLEPLHHITAQCVKSTLLCWARAVDLTALLDSEPQIALNVARSLHARVEYTLKILDAL